jgi:predicted nucleic acid-binding protein
MDTGNLRTSTQVLQESDVTMTRKIQSPAKPSTTLSLIEDLGKWPVIATDFALVKEGCALSQSAKISLWDALIVAAARRSRASQIYTEDLNSGQRFAGVEIVNPFL